MAINDDARLRFTSEAFTPHREYWRTRFSGVNGPFRFSIGEVDRSGEIDHASFSFTPEARAAYRRIAGEGELETFIVFIGALFLLMYRYTGRRTVIVETPFYKPSPPGGGYADRVPLVYTVDPDKTVKEMLIDIDEVVRGAYEYQDAPPSFFLHGDAQDQEVRRSNVFVTGDAIHEPATAGGSDLSFRIRREGDRAGVEISHDRGRFSAEMIDRLFMHVNRLSAGFTEFHRPCGRLPMLTETEHRRVVFEYNDTRSAYPEKSTATALFEDRVKTEPDLPAVFFSGNVSTYGELNAAANRLAHLLRNRFDIRPGEFVGLLLKRSDRMIVSILGVLKAGAAYLPIEPDNPGARIEHMLAETRARIVIADEKSALAAGDGQTVLAYSELETAMQAESPNNPPPVNTAGDRIYIMFTSGSTGRPKGVVCTHRNVVRLVINTNYTKITPGDRILQLSNYAFDGSTFDIFGALLNGACLYMIPPALLYSAEGLCRFIAKHRINITFITTALFNKLVDTDPAVVSRFDKIYFGGQDASLKHVRTALGRRKHADSIVHVYGPTEATTFSTYYVADQLGEDEKTIPIGGPIANSTAYILDENRNLLPEGLTGEIWVGGDGIAEGYLNRPDLTEKRFFPDPFRPGEWIYRTGDYGRWRAGGAIDFLGRIDEQVKIRGYRVELGEIENALLKHPAMTQAFVTALSSEDGTKSLAAYIVCDDSVTVSSLREFLSTRLPEYMVPAHFVKMAALPLNFNGKVDKTALPSPFTAGMSPDTEYVAPETRVEQILAEAFAAVLKKPRIGVTDNYFASGGDSIKAIQMVSRLKEAGLRLDIRQVFQYPTVSELAHQVTVDPQGTEASPETETGPLTGVVPLTPIQRWFFQAVRTDIHHFNQSVLLATGVSISESALKAALEALQRRHDALRAVYRTGSEFPLPVQEIRPPETMPVHLDVHDLRGEAAPDSVLEQICNAVQSGIDLETGPLMRAALFRTGSGDRLLIVIHHLVVDGVSWRILAEDLETAYVAAERGEAPVFLPKTANVKTWATRLREIAQGDELTGEIPYWRAVQKAIDAASIPGGPRTDDPPEKAADMETIGESLPAEETRRLTENIHSVYRTTIDDVLLTALAAAFQRFTGNAGLPLILEGHGREDDRVDAGRTIGWFTSRYPVYLEIPEKEDPGYRLRIIKEALRNIPRKGFGYGILRYLAGGEVSASLEPAVFPNVSFNYLGVFSDTDSGRFRFAEEPAGREIGPHTEIFCDIEFVCRVINGRFEIEIAFNRRKFSRERMHRLLRDYIEALQTLILHCEQAPQAALTPSDIDYRGVSVDELDDVLDRITSQL